LRFVVSNQMHSLCSNCIDHSFHLYDLHKYWKINWFVRCKTYMIYLNEFLNWLIKINRLKVRSQT
jgi:hypothetical protein